MSVNFSREKEIIDLYRYKTAFVILFFDDDDYYYYFVSLSLSDHGPCYGAEISGTQNDQ